MSIRQHSRIAVTVAVATLAVVAVAGCGGDDESPQARWAGDLCGALADWRSTVQTSADTLQDPANLSANSLDEAVTSVVDATTKLADDIEQLGPPETESGEAARQQFETYRSELEADAEELQSQLAAPSSGTAGLLQKVSTITATVGSMATSLEAAVSDVSEADVEGQLREALEEDSTCQELDQ